MRVTTAFFCGLMAIAVAPASAATISFEGFAPVGGLVNISPGAPYTEAGFTLTPTNNQSAVFDSAAASTMLGNNTDWFGFAESNAPSLTLTAGGGGLFSFTGILAGPSTIASGIPINITVTGSLFGGGVLIANLNTLSTATPFVFNWTNLTSLTFTATDDAGLDDIQVTAVPEPATLLLLGTGLGAVAARRRLKKTA